MFVELDKVSQDAGSIHGETPVKTRIRATLLVVRIKVNRRRRESVQVVRQRLYPDSQGPL